MKKVILITGASSGIGKASAKQFLKEGHTVYGCARRVEMMDDLKELGAKTFSMDVTNDKSIKSGVEFVLDQEEKIDVLISNAGYGSYGSLEDVSLEEARRQFEVNVFGLMRVIQLVLPSMRKNKSGKIINISSIAGKMYMPIGGWYNATKHSVEVLSDVLRMEVKQFGIDVVIVEPGAIKSEWADIADDSALKVSGNTVYSDMAKSISKVLKSAYKETGTDSIVIPAENVAGLLSHIVSTEKPQTRYTVGKMIKLPLLLKRIMPDKMFDGFLNWRLNQIASSN